MWRAGHLIWPFLGGLLLLLAGLHLPADAGGQTDFPDVCQDRADNLVRNCRFNDQLKGWNTFVEAGTRPDFRVVSGSDCHSPRCPALRIEAAKWFIGGVYQRIGGVTPGQHYWANVIWLVYDPAGVRDNAVGRRIGIDPTGGTDPRSPNVVWSPHLWTALENCPNRICPELQVRAVAQNTTITLFVRVEATWKNRCDEFPDVPAYFFTMTERFWIDDVGMIAAAPTPTPLPVPVTTTVTSQTGGRLLANDADGSVSVEFPPGAVEGPCVVTYTYQAPPPLDGLTGVDRFFRLDADVTAFSQPVTIAVRYPAVNPLVRETIALHRLSGTTWLTDGIAPVERTADALTGTTALPGAFGLLGETNRVHLPVITR